MKQSFKTVVNIEIASTENVSQRRNWGFSTLFQSLLLLVFVLILQSCSSDITENNNAQKVALTAEQLIKINQTLVQGEKEKIQSFTDEKGWNMQETGSGLQYYVYKKGAGKPIKFGDIVQIYYTQQVILEKDTASISELHKIEFIVDKTSEIPSGIDELVKLLTQSSKATAIIPSHLAYGIAGDKDQNIPPKAILLYDIEVVKVK